jgi:hypothetical protein
MKPIVLGRCSAGGRAAHKNSILPVRSATFNYHPNGTGPVNIFFPGTSSSVDSRLLMRRTTRFRKISLSFCRLALRPDEWCVGRRASASFPLSWAPRTPQAHTHTHSQQEKECELWKSATGVFFFICCGGVEILIFMPIPFNLASEQLPWPRRLIGLH